MSAEFERKKHTLYMLNRETLELGGINDVDAFNEEQITASCDWGNILIKGSNLHIEALDLESGEVKISGKIGAFVYNESAAAGGFFKRVFS